MSKIEVKLNPDCLPTGSDLSVVQAARRSFGSRSDWDYFTDGSVNGRGELNEWVGLKEKDKNLLRFLARGMSTKDWEEFIAKVSVVGEASCKASDDCEYNDEAYFDHQMTELLWKWRNTPSHSTPFDHTFISFECKAPVFTARQLVKHEYLIWSEISRRYITDDIEFYEPEVWRAAPEDKKQGSGEALDWEHTPYCHESCLNNYKFLIESGVAPEMARMVLPQSMMVEWTWSGTLGAFAKMCRERLDPHSQYESRVVAQKVYDYLKEYYPVSAPLLVEGVY